MIDDHALAGASSICQFQNTRDTVVQLFYRWKIGTDQQHAVWLAAVGRYDSRLYW